MDSIVIIEIDRIYRIVKIVFHGFFWKPRKNPVHPVDPVQ
jgi:hypothetical protein